MDTQTASSFFSALLPQDSPTACAVRLWDGTCLKAGAGDPVFEVQFRTPDAVKAVIAEPSLGFGDAYVAGKVDVRGDLSEALALAYRRDLFSSLSPAQKVRAGLLRAGRGRTVRQSRNDIKTHYDRGNAFYQLWLDTGMNYSCGYFATPEDSLEQAQEQKNTLILRKLRVKPGQRLLDIGCGWGALVLQAAGSQDLAAVGLTISSEQHAFARERIAAAGLEDRVEVRLQDYRKVPSEETETFDRIASVGMFEHVGQRNLSVFFETAARLLRPGGLLLLHTIGRVRPAPTDPWIERHIFPGGYIPALGEVVAAATGAGLDFVDLENLRDHYDLTIGHWIRRFEAQAETIGATMGAPFVRMWRLYLHGSQMAFRHGDLQLYQFLFSRGRRTDWPLTRDWMSIERRKPASA